MQISIPETTLRHSPIVAAELDYLKENPEEESLLIPTIEELDGLVTRARAGDITVEQRERLRVLASILSLPVSILLNK